MRHERHIHHYLQNQGAIESGRQDETREDRSVVRVESPSDGIGRKEWPGSRRTCKQNTQIPKFGRPSREKIRDWIWDLTRLVNG